MSEELLLTFKVDNEALLLTFKVDFKLMIQEHQGNSKWKQEKIKWYHNTIKCIVAQISQKQISDRQTTSFNDFSIEAGILLRGNEKQISNIQQRAPNSSESVMLLTHPVDIEEIQGYHFLSSFWCAASFYKPWHVSIFDTTYDMTSNTCILLHNLVHIGKLRNIQMNLT